MNKAINVFDILESEIKKNKCDGLVNINNECSCKLGELAESCDNLCSHCYLGIKVDCNTCECYEECEFEHSGCLEVKIFN